MVESSDITITERKNQEVFENQFNIEALMARDIDVLELDPPMAYDAVRFIKTTDILNEYGRRPIGTLNDREWNEFANLRGGYPEIRYLNFKDPFKITLNPRTSVTFVLWFPTNDINDDRVYTTTVNYQFIAKEGQVSNALRPDDVNIDYLTSEWVDATNYTIGQVINLIEGDYIEWTGTKFTIKAQGQILFSRESWVVNEDVSEDGDDPVMTPRDVLMSIPFKDYGLNIATIEASWSVPSQEQQGSSGLLDDPLTPDIDETIEPSSDTPFSDRIARVKEALRLEREIRFKNRGRKTIGGILFLVIGVGLVYFFTKSRIFNTVKEEVTNGIEGVGEVV